MSDRSTDSRTFAKWNDDGAELAILDLRSKEDATGYGQPLFGKNLPADILLDQIHLYVPRKAVRTVLVDGGDGRGAEFASKLYDEGWEYIHALTGGFPAWLESGEAEGRAVDIAGKTFSLSVPGEGGTLLLLIEPSVLTNTIL